MVFEENNAAKYINSTFIPFRVVKGKDEYPQLRAQFKITGFPTVVVLGPDAEERDRIIGFGDNAEAFLTNIRDFAANKNTLAVVKAAYDENPQGVQENFNLAQKYLDRFALETAYPYYQKVVELDPEDKFGYKEKSEFNIALYLAQYEENELPLEEMLKNITDLEMLEIGYYRLINAVEKKGDTDLTLMTYKRAMHVLPDYASMMNSCAWYIYENKLQPHYEWGIQLAQQAVSIEPQNDSIWDTLAWLCDANGNKQEALEAMQKALSLQPDSEYYQNAVEQLKAKL